MAESAARQAAQARVAKFIPVEKGVTGKEKLFQQNRNFGPGPTTPYLEGQQEKERRPYQPLQSGKGSGRQGGGVYTGAGRYGTKDGTYRRGEQRA